MKESRVLVKHILTDYVREIDELKEIIKSYRASVEYAIENPGSYQAVLMTALVRDTTNLEEDNEE